MTIAPAVDILLVDDDPNDVDLVQHALRAHGPSNAMSVVWDGAEALEFLLRTGRYADRTSSGPAVVLLDLNLPKFDGLEVLRRIRADADLRTLPVVMLTSSQEERDIIESYQLGVNSFITKPVDFQQFSAAMRAITSYWLSLNQPPRRAGAAH